MKNLIDLSDFFIFHYSLQIVRMTKGEKCRLLITGSKYTYTSECCPHEALKPGDALELTLHLKDFQKVPQNPNLSDKTIKK